MDVVASLPFVSPVFVKKSVTTTFARSPKWLPNISLPLDITIYTFHNAAGGQEMESTREPQPLLEWFMEKYRKFGANLEFVTNRSQEGSQFVRDLGDIGGLLRCNGRLSTMLSADE
uniref:eRF1 domain-containing protein n=1 Tax=Moniliophthora roreri TaxID=221103 RepID=A0A0W0FS05_MONRR